MKTIDVIFTTNTAEEILDLKAKLLFWRTMAAGLGIIVGILTTIN